MLQNVLMASSIAKAVQVLGATLSLRQLKDFLISQPAMVQDDDMICCMSSSFNSTLQSTSLSCHLKAEEKGQSVICEEKQQPSVVILPPNIIQSPEIDSERPPLLLPPIQAIIPEISNPKPMKTSPLISWGGEGDVTVQYQKQTSSQLLHFLKGRAKNMGAMAFSVVECTKTTCTPSSSQQTSPVIKKQSCPLKPDDLINALAPKTLLADTENLAPVFRVKQVESSGSLTYTCVIATRTELWDIGDILTKEGHSDNSLMEREDCKKFTAQVENTCVSIQWKTEHQLTENNIKDVSAETPAANSIKIPEFQIQKFEETEVVVSHIVSPGNFYIQNADSLTKLHCLVPE